MWCLEYNFGCEREFVWISGSAHGDVVSGNLETKLACFNGNKVNKEYMWEHQAAQGKKQRGETKSRCEKSMDRYQGPKDDNVLCILGAYQKQTFSQENV